MLLASEARDGAERDPRDDETEEQRLNEDGQVLRLAVSVVVRAVGRLRGDAETYVEEPQGQDVEDRIEGLRQDHERARRRPDPDLGRRQGHGYPHRYERVALGRQRPSRRHGLRVGGAAPVAQMFSLD